MQTATREELLQLVLSRIDELSLSDETISVPPLLIEKEMDEAALQIIHSAKKEMLFSSATSLHELPALIQYKTAEPTVPQSVVVPISSEFARYLRMRLKDWKIASDDIVSVDTNEYKNQFNKFMSASAMRPTVALIPFYFEYVDVDNKKVKTYNAIEAFPAPLTISAVYRTTASDTTETNIKAAALAKGYGTIFNTSLSGAQKALMNELIVVYKMPAEKMPDMLISAVAWKAAEVCLRSLREITLADSALAKCKEALGIQIGLKSEGKK